MRIHFSYVETHDLALAAALLAVGIPFNEETPFIKIKTPKGGDQYKFFFKEQSDCGNFTATKLIAAWDDENFHLENPEHPFAYIKCAFKNRDGLLDVVKQSNELIVIEKNGKLAIISKNASKELQNKIFSKV